MATENGTTTERVYVEKSGGGGVGGILLGVAALALVAIIAFFALSYNRNEAVRTEAVSNAAASVADSASSAADSVGDAVTPDR